MGDLKDADRSKHESKRIRCKGSVRRKAQLLEKIDLNPASTDVRRAFQIAPASLHLLPCLSMKTAANQLLAVYEIFKGNFSRNEIMQ